MTPLQLTRSVRSLNRLRHIAQVLTRHGFGHVVAQIHLSRFVPVWMMRHRPPAEPSISASRAIGRRLAQVCAELGPTFIKFGQMLSMRPDVVPEDVIAELRALQDDVPPFPTQEAMEIIASELGRPVSACFASFDDTPFASASIGQVYHAEAKDGTKLVVKVRRPGIDDTITLDMQLLRWLADSLERLMPELRVYHPSMLVDELDRMLQRELDYVNEASTAARFAEFFADEAGIHFPEVFWDCCGTRVLTFERMPGSNVDFVLSSIAGGSTEYDTSIAARRLTDCFLRQVFELGVFHADPHPGNVLIEPPAGVSLIDFGQVGTVSDELMTNLIVMVYAAVNREIDLMVDTLADMDALGVDTHRRQLAGALQVWLDKYYGLPLKRMEIGKLSNELADVVRRHDVMIPQDMLMLLKALGTIGTIARRLDPDLNLLELLGPRIKRAMQERLSARRFVRGTMLWSWHLLNLVRGAPAHLRDFLRGVRSGSWKLHVHHENSDRLIRELDRSSNRLAFSVVIAAIIVGSSVVITTNPELTLLGFPIQYLGIAGYVVAGILGLGLSWAIVRSGRLH